MAINRQFYVDRAVDHGSMAAYYIEQIKALTLIPPAHESELTWALEHAASEAQEAWHYALLMTPGQIEAELQKQAEQARQDARLEF